MIRTPEPAAVTDITAVVLTCNRPARCADSIHHNSLALSRFNARILLINNSDVPLSPPDTTDGIPCEVVNCGKNMGIAARNLAFSRNNSEFLLILDDDAYITPDHIERMINAFRTDPSIAAVSFKIRNSREEEACLLPTVFHGCACGFRTRALREIGGYPEDFQYYGEEYFISFRLYQHGHRIIQLDGNESVFHARDQGGRNMNRIIRYLIRNNIRTWAALFPWKEIRAASMDTLQRYARVARKEKALRGFLLGCAEIPYALWRGFLDRAPISKDLFDHITMSNHISNLCRSLKARGIHQVIICAVGKFPSSWLTCFNTHGILVKAFWDNNSCWSGGHVHGIPVTATEQAENWTRLRHEFDHRPLAWIVGTGSLAENTFWQNTLKSIGLQSAPPPSSAQSSPGSGNFDLLRDCRFSAFAP